MQILKEGTSMRMLEITIRQHKLSSCVTSCLRRFYELTFIPSVIFLLVGCAASSSTLNIYNNCFPAKSINAGRLLNMSHNDSMNTDFHYFPVGSHMSENEATKLIVADFSGYIFKAPSDEWSTPVDLNSLIYFSGGIAINKSDWMKIRVGLPDRFYFVVRSEKGKYLLDYNIGWQITGIANARELMCVN